MSDNTPPPIVVAVPPNRIVKASRTAWFLSFAIGAAVVLMEFLWRHEQVERLRAVVADLDPDAGQDAIEAAAALVFWAGLSALALTIVVELVVVVTMLRGYRAARWALLVILLFHGAVLTVSGTLLDADGTGDDYVHLLLVGQLGLAAVGLVLSFFPSAGEWFAGELRARRSRA